MPSFFFKEWDPEQQLTRVAQADGPRQSKVKVQDCRLSHCLFTDKHLKEVSFIGGSIIHSRFVNCRLTKANFERVDFSGTSFVGCDLRSATFNMCQTRYVTFDNCELNYKSLLESAPREPNLRSGFLRRLRVNATQVGEKHWADRLLMMELSTRQQELWSILLGNSDYYRKKYPGIERVGAGIDLTLHLFNRFWWGHGLRVSNLALSGTIVLAVFATLFRLRTTHFLVEGNTQPGPLTWSQAAYYSVSSFTTVGAGDIRPINGAAQLFTSLEAITGVLFLGFFAAAMYRRLAK